MKHSALQHFSRIYLQTLLTVGHRLPPYVVPEALSRDVTLVLSLSLAVQLSRGAGGAGGVQAAVGEEEAEAVVVVERVPLTAGGGGADLHDNTLEIVSSEVYGYANHA